MNKVVITGIRLQLLTPLLYKFIKHLQDVLGAYRAPSEDGQQIHFLQIRGKVHGPRKLMVIFSNLLRVGSK